MDQLGDQPSARAMGRPARIVLFANSDWYLFNFRLSLAERLRELGHDLLLLSPPGEYGERLKAMGFHWQALPMDRRSLNPLKEARLVGELIALFRREKPDLVHNFTIKPAVYGSLAARLAGVKGRVNAVAGLGYVFISDEPRARLLRPLVRTLLKQALEGANARLILQNPDDVALFTRRGLVRSEHARLIPSSGVDCERFMPPVGERGPHEPLKVLVACRLLWDKGLREYVEAARMLKREGRSIRFLLAGDPDPGNPASIPPETAKGWAEEGVVEWLGHVSDMAALFADVDVVALPSYREGLPRSLIEAGAAARALVTTDVPGCREVVTDGVDGLLVPACDAEALARAIARLDDDRELVARLGATAREGALARYDQRQVVADTLAVYDELLPRGARA